MNIPDIFSPVGSSFYKDQNFERGSLVNYIKINGRDEINVNEGNVALVSVNSSGELMGNNFRNFFYRLSRYPLFPEIIDLGDIAISIDDKSSCLKLAYALGEIIELKAQVILIATDETIAFIQYLTYEYLQRLINIALIDSKIKINTDKTGKAESFLDKVFDRENSFLFNLVNIGNQSYFLTQDVIELFERMKFEQYRLGEVRQNFLKMEPAIRSADMMALNLSVIKQSNAPAAIDPSPNGFTSDEICLVSRYAGLSDQLSTFGIYGFDESKDNEHQTAHLVAQIAWYFVEGISQRINEHPDMEGSEFIKYVVFVKDNAYQLSFYKSKQTNRWWMEIPSEFNQSDKSQFIPCSYEDYLEANNGDVPERLWNALQKFI